MKDVKDASAAVYIPTAFTEVIAMTTALMGKEFGSTINVKAERAWVDGKVIKEDVTIIRSWYDSSLYILATAFIIDLAVKIKGRCKQDCVTVEVEGDMILI